MAFRIIVIETFNVSSHPRNSRTNVTFNENVNYQNRLLSVRISPALPIDQATSFRPWSTRTQFNIGALSPLLHCGVSHRLLKANRTPRDRHNNEWPQQIFYWYSQSKQMVHHHKQFQHHPIRTSSLSWHEAIAINLWRYPHPKSKPTNQIARHNSCTFRPINTLFHHLTHPKGRALRTDQFKAHSKSTM